MARAVGSVDSSTTVFLCCDIQERFRPIIRDFDKVVTASSMLMKGAQALRCPVIVTEQYPKGLGKTVDELVLHDGVEVYEKTAFSMMIEPVRHKIQSYGSRSAVLFGIEGHVCVLQTALDLMQQGVDVHLPVDAISSTHWEDRRIALERLSQCGAFLTTTESILFQLAKDARNASFKVISALAKEPRVRIRDNGSSE